LSDDGEWLLRDVASNPGCDGFAAEADKLLALNSKVPVG